MVFLSLHYMRPMGGLFQHTYLYWKLKQATNCGALLFDAWLFRCNTTSNHIDQNFILMNAFVRS